MKTTSKVRVEIRAAEGGEDAKLLVNEMANIYQKTATINNFDCSTEH
jgi:protein subunit release factor A